jgi:hypothetical protein
MVLSSLRRAIFRRRATSQLRLWADESSLATAAESGVVSVPCALAGTAAAARSRLNRMVVFGCGMG